MKGKRDPAHEHLCVGQGNQSRTTGEINVLKKKKKDRRRMDMVTPGVHPTRRGDRDRIIVATKRDESPMNPEGWVYLDL